MIIELGISVYPDHPPSSAPFVASNSGRLVVEMKSDRSLADLVSNFNCVCFGTDFTSSILGGTELGEVLASAINEFSDSMSSQLILLALYLFKLRSTQFDLDESSS